MKLYTRSSSKAFPLILIYSIALILSGLTVPTATGTDPVTFEIVTRTTTGDDLEVDVNITSPAGSAIVGWMINISVNPDVLKPGYLGDYQDGVWFGYFLFDWGIVNGHPSTLEDPEYDTTAGWIWGYEIITQWRVVLTKGEGADGNGTLVTFKFEQINQTTAYSPIVITEAYYYTSWNLGEPDELDERVPNIINGHFGEPIHEVGIDSVGIIGNKPFFHRGELVELNATVSNNGGYTETFNVSTYYNKTATEWELIRTKNFTSPPLLPLGPLESTTQKFSPKWDTKDVEPGNYTIKANITVAGDVNATNDVATTTIDIRRPKYDLAVTEISANITSPFIGDIVEINVTAKVWDAHKIDETPDPVNFSVSVDYISYIQNGSIGSGYATLVPEGETRNFTIYWNTAGVPASTPSNYTIEATTILDPISGWEDLIDFNDSNSTEVQVRIPGDVNSDGIVDIFDIGTISAHWSPGPPPGPEGYNALVDINHDGDIDIDDIEMASDHWGETT